ncbi:MAG TPA: hypothetical protein VJI33_00105 [Candidatus Paceibacterota bacterium]
MGSLTKLPFSEIGATLEHLERYGVMPEHFELIRSRPGLDKQVAVAIAKICGGTNESLASTFNLWRTIKLGTGLVTADDFRRALKAAGHHIGDWANDILGQCAFTASTKETEVDLVVVSVSELGFPNGATRQEIYRKAQKLGLMLCSPEVGPQLRLQYPDQPLNQWLLIGMEPIAGSVGYLRVFSVGRLDDGSWLSSNFGDADNFWDGDSLWVFVRGK